MPVRRHRLIRLLLCALPLVGAIAADPVATSLFDGKTLAGWEGDSAWWRVEGGAITGEIPAGTTLGGNQFLYWTGEAADFELTASFRISGGPSANSGIQFRSRRGADGHAAGYQADLDDGATWLGRIYDEHGRALLVERGTRVSIAPDGRRWVDPFATPESFRPLLKKPGEWNTYRIRALASHVELWINGALWAAFDDHQADAADYAGRIALQLHSGPGPATIQFRDLALVDLGATALPPPLAGGSAAQVGPAAGFAVTGADGEPLDLGFESGSLAGWTATGDAWKGQPIKGDTVSPRKPGMSSNHAGAWWIGGYETIGDEGTGTLTSPAFEVTRPWASFLIGGGRNASQTRVELIDAASGAVLHTASGDDHETMRRVAVDLGAARGKRIAIRLVDEHRGGWGHLNFDDFVFHDAAPVVAAAPGPGGLAARQHESPVLWHLRPNPAKATALPGAPGQSTVAGMRLVHGFQAELIAAEPAVRQPIAFAIDPRGRLFVAEAQSYPNKRKAGEGQDRVLVFADADGDGSFETQTVFCEGLDLVSGIELGFGGVWIGAAPHLLFIPDRDADGKADGAPEVVLDGWGYQDTHETLNSFTWGPDGWLYGNQGVFTTSHVGTPGSPDAQRVRLQAGVWRYHPVLKRFELFAHGGSNQWGLDFNAAGHLFMTHCRSFHGGGGTSHVIRNGHYWNQVNAGYAPFISNAGPGFAPQLRNYLPASARYDSGEGGAGKPGTTAVYGGHSHVGTMIYNGDNWPAIYRDHLFTHNLHGHQLNHQHSVRSGSGYETLHAGYDLLFAPDASYIAVDLQTGPDGAAYLIDWYDDQHCHTPANEKWDRSNGRIYRLSWAATWRPRPVDLAALDDAALASLQGHANDWHARTARRLLQERAATRAIDAAALAWLRQRAAATGDTGLALRALWTLHVAGGLDADGLAAATRHPSDLVRAWAVQFATEGAGSRLPVPRLVDLASADPSPTVRLALASALPTLAGDAAWAVASALAAHGEDADDRFLPRMLWFGMAPLAARDAPRALALAASTPLPTLADSIRWSAAGQREAREALVAQLASAPEAVAARGVRLLAFALRSESAVAPPAAWPALQARFSAADGETRATVDQLAALFGDQGVLERTRALLADGQAPMDQRRGAFDLLKRLGDPKAVAVFAGLLDLDEFRTAVIPLLARSDDPRTAEALIQRFAAFSEGDRAAALHTLTSRPTLARPLLEAVQAAAFDRRLLTALQIRQLRNLKDAGIDQLLDRTWGKAVDTSDSAKATMARLKKTFEQAPLWAYDRGAGRKVFERSCVACHALGGVGGKLGPDLAGSWRNGVDYFLESIVDPDAVVGDAFQMQVVTLEDGAVLLGMIDSETDTTLVVRTIAETVNVPKAGIRDRQKMAQSLMPPGLLEGLQEREAIELLKFLTTKE